MAPELAESIRFCRSLARRTGKNFYWSFLTLPRQMRQDMCVLYAFMRLTDDIGDRHETSVESRQFCLEVWHRAWKRILDCRLGRLVPDLGTRDLPPAGFNDAVPFIDPDEEHGLEAMAELVIRRAIPSELLDDVIAGVASDLTPRRFTTFPELERYCYQVAGAVGLCCIHIWGFSGDDARRYAIDCGTAFQLTNILRDLREDARGGRVYLPQSEMERFNVSETDLREGPTTDGARQLIQFQVARARQFYSSATQLLPLLSQPGQRVFAAMLGIYGGLLDEIERRGGDVLSARVEVSTSYKAWAAMRGWLSPTSVADAVRKRYSSPDDSRTAADLS